MVSKIAHSESPALDHYQQALKKYNTKPTKGTIRFTGKDEVANFRGTFRFALAPCHHLCAKWWGNLPDAGL